MTAINLRLYSVHVTCLDGCLDTSAYPVTVENGVAIHRAQILYG